MHIHRRKSIEVIVGGVGVGGQNPVRVQSMTNTLTADVQSTANQVFELARAGSELVRFTVKDDDDAKAVPYIRESLAERGCAVPLIGDFHFNGHRLLSKYPEAARALDKYRINPGNVGSGVQHDKNFTTFIDIALKNGKPVRIGVNFGSIDQAILTRLMDENTAKPTQAQKSAEEITVDALVISAVESAKLAERLGLPRNKIILSTKVSRVPELIGAYTRLGAETDYALHLGLTEAGMGAKGIVASTAGLTVLLQQGIGDTIRVSLTPGVGKPRTEEVQVAQLILQLNAIRRFTPTVTSCPGCGRTTSTLFQELSEKVNDYLLEKTPEWKSKNYRGVEEMVVAVMGCVVNGPGESREANVGLSLPGTGEDPLSPVFVDGARKLMLRGDARIEDFKKIIDDYVETRYSPKAR